MPRGRPDKCEIKREGKRKRSGGHESVGLLRAPREPVNHATGCEDAPAHADGDYQRVIDRDFVELHVFLTHEKKERRS